jgi:alpha-mannosidase
MEEGMRRRARRGGSQVQLTIRQRLDRLRVLLQELSCWRLRTSVELTSWSCDGQPIGRGELWPSRQRIARMAHPTAEVPADWPLEHTRLRLDLGDETLLKVLYPGGAWESFGNDGNHKEMRLRERAFSLEAVSVARHEFGDPNRDPRLRESALILIEPAVQRLAGQLELIIDAVEVLTGHEVVPHLLAAAEHAFTGLQWPSETVPYVTRVAGTRQLRNVWHLPETFSAPPTALTEDELRTVETAATTLHEELAALQRRYPQQGALAVTGHAHIDLAWLWPMDETRRKARRTFSTVVGLLDRNPDFRFNQSTAQLYAFLEEDDPELFERVSEKVRAGRWEPVGGMWVEPDTNMPTGESLARQAIYGQRYFERHFGRRHSVCWLPDCFGFSAALPQILRGAGIDSFFTIKVNWSETNRFPHDLFWWEGLDGSRVLAHTFDNPGSTRPQAGELGGLGGYNGDVRPINLTKTWGNFRGKALHDESLLAIGHGDGGGGPRQEMLDDAVELAAFPILPTIRFSTVHDFFRRLHETASEKEVPTWVGEIYLELHRGTLTTQGRTKRLHRQAERALLAAESLGAMTALFCGGTPSSLEPLWQVLLRNEFHDILPGSSIREVYELAEAELAEVVGKARDTAGGHVDRLAEKLAERGSGERRPGLLVVNPDLQPRPLRLQLAEGVPGSQQVESGHLLAGGEPVPGLSVSMLGSPAPVGPLSVGERHLENDVVRLELDERGTVTRVYDKRARREALDGRGNQLWAYLDKPRAWDAWDVDASYAQVGEEITDLESLEVIERGPFRAAIRVRRRFRSSTITQEIRLWANSARIDFATTLDWRDRRWLLKARFPLALQTDHATFECAYGVVRRPTLRNTSWEEAKFEVAGHRFADLSEPGFGVALLNDGRYGHHVAGGELGLSLLRSPVWPDPLADEGVQSVTYSLLPHVGDWFDGGVLSEADDLNQPLRARPVEAAGSQVWTAARLEGLPLALGTLKVAEDSDDLVLRVYEPRGARGEARIDLPEGWQLTSELNLLEDDLGDPELTFTPFQLRTYRLKRSPS